MNLSARSSNVSILAFAPMFQNKRSPLHSPLAARFIVRINAILRKPLPSPWPNEKIHFTPLTRAAVNYRADGSGFNPASSTPGSLFAAGRAGGSVYPVVPLTTSAGASCLTARTRDVTPRASRYLAMSSGGTRSPLSLSSFRSAGRKLIRTRTRRTSLWYCCVTLRVAKRRFVI